MPVTVPPASGVTAGATADPATEHCPARRAQEGFLALQHHEGALHHLFDAPSTIAQRIAALERMAQGLSVLSGRSPHTPRTGVDMIVLLLATVFALTSWLVRTHATDAFRRSPASDAQPGRQNPAGCCALSGDKPTNSNAEPAAWTALDDHQLNRLLKDSSP